MILEHLDCEELVEGRDYFARTVNAEIEFRNGSLIKPLYWSDNKFTRIRSVPLSAAIFEEITENDEDDQRAFFEIKARIGRVLHVKEKFIIAATNPDDPTHWVARYFIRDKQPSRRVFYSNTLQNPFLPPSYIEQLKKDMHPKLAERLIYGKWVTLHGEKLYYGYETEQNYRDYSFDWKNTQGDVTLTFDFNIGQGKPMSSCAFLTDRYDDHHVFKTFAIESARTEEALEHWDDYGLFANLREITICGDASGRARDTRGKFSDWDIVGNFLKRNYPALVIKWRIPNANPAIRVRQNVVNSLCKDGNGKTRLRIYKDAKLLDEGLNGTKARKGSTYDEDDSFFAQHVVAALGYGLVPKIVKSSPINMGRY